MKNLIDTIFNPLLNWLNSIYNNINSLNVPFSHPVDVSNYLGVFALLGPAWVSFVVNACLMAFIYVICLIIISQHGIFIKFKDTVKWW